MMREHFERKLLDQGLELELEPSKVKHITRTY